jgi:hypothetical protein
VEDTNGNVVVYSYTQETNWYSSPRIPNSVHPYKLVQYVRGGYPAVIEYTRRAGDGSAAPTARVAFSTAPRCLDPDTTGLCDWPADYPDTPADLACSGSGPCGSQQPTFWITQRLSRVATSVWDTAASAWRGVGPVGFGLRLLCAAALHRSDLWLSHPRRPVAGRGLRPPPQAGAAEHHPPQSRRDAEPAAGELWLHLSAEPAQL